jgi:hypothetical protein
MKNIIAAIIITVIIVGGGSFFGGIKYAQAKNSISAQFSNASGRQFGTGTNATRQGRNANSGFVNGSIISKDDKSITVKLQDGGSKIIFLSGSTTISKTTDGALSDLEVGKNVMVNGSANQDGSITAQSIQIRPAGINNPAGQPTTPAAK